MSKLQITIVIEWYTTFNVWVQTLFYRIFVVPLTIYNHLTCYTSHSIVPNYTFMYNVFHHDWFTRHIALFMLLLQMPSFPKKDNCLALQITLVGITLSKKFLCSTLVILVVLNYLYGIVSRYICRADLTIDVILTFRAVLTSFPVCFSIRQY